MKTLFYLSLICVVTLFSACGSNIPNDLNAAFSLFLV